MHLKLHRKAEAKIRQAAAWYDGQSPGLGHRFVQAVAAAFELLEGDPQRFAKLETMVELAPYRRVLVEGFPYVVIFELFEHEVFVFAVTHASRRPNYWRQRKRKSP